MTENIIDELNRIIEENSTLKVKVAEQETAIRNLSMRERLYQSSLSTLKNSLLKFAQGIVTTPHSRDNEYQKTVYGDDNDR